jgi:phosphatidate phosphatase APP1
VRPAPLPARALTPPAAARLGVISDIDDTIIRTGANALLRNWRTILLASAETRVPFRGLAPIYRALEHGPGGGGAPVNPIS